MKKQNKDYTNEQKIKYVLDNFDFKKVERIMKVLKWKWYNHKTEEMYQPNVKQLKKSAKRMLKFCRRCGTSSGGFHAKHDGMNYTLDFVIEERESWWMGR